MCGIAGTWQAGPTTASELGALAGAMSDAISLRGPDDSGRWVDAEVGIGLGHRRLSIVDLSPAGHQPMVSASSRYVICFNGEVYNFAELRSELPRQAWRGESDTEVMLAAIEQWGLSGAIARFIGMFAFALWDREERRLHLVRDRLGIKPLYFGRAGKGLVFGSELKSLLAHPELDRTIDTAALAAYFRFGYVPAPQTIFRSALKLEPGTVLSFDAAGAEPTKHRYWNPETFARGELAPFQGTLQDAADELEQLLRSSVKLRMIADVPLGAFLSGGVDSSTVVALMQSMSARPVKTFSIGNESAAYDESSQAAAVAHHLGTDHTSLIVSAQAALAVVPDLPRMYDEPFADSSQIPTFLVSRLARQQVTVALSGDGGDELFAGYNRHVFVPPIAKAVRYLPAAARQAGAWFLTNIAGAVDEHGGLARRWVRLPGQKLSKVGAVLAAGSEEAMYRALCSQWAEPLALVRGVEREAAAAGTWLGTELLSSLLLADQQGYLPNDILTKVDRASMFTSLEARVPLLDHRVVELSWRLPNSIKRRGLRGKLPLRRVLEKYVPRELTERPKMGFGVPVGAWLRGPLREWAETLLSPARLHRAGLLEPTLVADTWSRHLSGTEDGSARLWSLLMFEAWHDWLLALPRRSP